jgi:hypothetical protein
MQATALWIQLVAVSAETAAAETSVTLKEDPPPNHQVDLPDRRASRLNVSMICFDFSSLGHWNVQC